MSAVSVPPGKSPLRACSAAVSNPLLLGSTSISIITVRSVPIRIPRLSSTLPVPSMMSCASLGSDVPLGPTAVKTM